MKYRVEIWGGHNCFDVIQVLNFLIEFGVAIAWIKTRRWKHYEIVNFGLIFPYTFEDNERQVTQKAFNKKLFSISRKDEVGLGGDTITVYNTPISPYAPGDGGLIELKDCLYVPPNFHSIDEQ